MNAVGVTHSYVEGDPQTVTMTPPTHPKAGILLDAWGVILDSLGDIYEDKYGSVILTAAVHPLDKNFSFPLAAVQSRSSDYEPPALA